MTEILTARSNMKNLLEATFSELAGNVEQSKRDRVESLPSASVYVGQVQSEPIAARGHVERTFDIEIEVHRNSANVEDVLFTNAETLEAAVYAERKNFATKVKRINLSEMRVQLDPQQKGVGTLHLTFSITSSASIAG